MSKKQADYSAFLSDLADGMIETANEPFTRIAERDDCIECANKLKETADAYDAMLAALEYGRELVAEDKKVSKIFKDAIALAKPVTGKAASASRRQGD